MADHERENKTTADGEPRRVIGLRYPVWKVHLLDAVAKRRDMDRAHVMEEALDRLLHDEGVLGKVQSRAA